MVTKQKIMGRKQPYPPFPPLSSDVTNTQSGHYSSVQRVRHKTLKKTAMKSEDNKPFLHVTGGLLLCILAVASGIFDGAHTDTGYEHYAEPMVPGMPAFLAMPANCLINLAYILLGWYWWPSGDKGRQTYFQEVFALMALLYGPTQWVRLWTQHHWAAVGHSSVDLLAIFVLRHPYCTHRSCLSRLAACLKLHFSPKGAHASEASAHNQ
ncbi:Transmembrane protein, partial [Ophiophagus hannah]